MYTKQSPVLGRGSLGISDVVKHYRNAQRTLYFSSFVCELFNLCAATGINFDVAIAKAAEETSGFTDARWRDSGNPAGIGATDSGDEDVPNFTDGITAARIYVVHLCAYVFGNVPPAVSPYLSLDTRWQHVVRANLLGSITKIGDFGNGRWASNPGDADNILGQLEALGAKEEPVSFSTEIPGLPGGPLVTDYPIRFNMLAVDGFQREGIEARTPRRSIQHGTDNPSNESAWDEAQYFVNGAEGRQASVHSFADDHEIVIGMPFDEVAWQAADGNGPGNMNGFSNEMMEADAIWASNIRRDRLISIAADFMGRVSARFGVHIPERHWDFNADSPDRHHCPNRLMNTGLWESSYVPQWNTARIDELRRMGGKVFPVRRETPPRDGKDHELYDVTWRACRRVVKTLRPTPRLQVFSLHGPRVGPDIKAGEEFFVDWKVNAKNAFFVTDIGTVVYAADVTPSVAIADRKGGRS